MTPETQSKMSSTRRDAACSDSHFSLAHSLELDVQRELLSQDRWQFRSLVVHRTRDGICLQGVLECSDEDERDEVCKLVREVAGVRDILNQLVVRKPVEKG